MALSTRGEGDVLDITVRIEKALSEIGLSSGIVSQSINIFVLGSTAAVTTLEYK